MSTFREPGSVPKGFTLIELMIVVSIIGILAVIVVPKFSDLIQKSREGANKGNLGAFRSALQIYYAAMEGQFPIGIGCLTPNGKYLQAIPKAYLPEYHGISAIGPGNGVIQWVDFLGGTGNWDMACPPNNVFGSGWVSPSDNTGFCVWSYMRNTGDPDYGNVHVWCTHTDSKGSIWSGY